MNQHDIFYTPNAIAQACVAAISNKPSVVADFAAGDGSLLAAARQRWGNIPLVGTDVSASSVKRLRRAVPSATVGVCDFLNPSSRARSKPLLDTRFRVDLALLNPPFSCRGASTVAVEFNGISVKCSVALAFVITALTYLCDEGEIVAILPASTIRAEKDHRAWQLLRHVAEFDIFGSNDRNAFRDCFPNTIMVRFKLKQNVGDNFAFAGFESSRAPRTVGVKIVRGKIQMFKAPIVGLRAGLPFVHSTELRQNMIDLHARRIRKGIAPIEGPAVLLPRVGLPDRRKIAVLGPMKVVLSDCVLAIQCVTESEAAGLVRAMQRDWASIAQLYGGTGAPYLTMEQLANWLVSRGYLLS